ncbi:hypothetical protein JNUCC1_01621 [Lentibacillus sp. JNUCC-1]|uniref:hypothetical protein n=1 Tax=Lentibacillus sp. JNUCC-1 TaxID=2654513 RepID=UPI0012E7AB0A|nr:hypothetical protein [Lentibacillus sp. JNUCC-1]MUV37815.1 hypothetical protein [Lentibacillus sp. JNUCC-1]
MKAVTKVVALLVTLIVIGGGNNYIHADSMNVKEVGNDQNEFVNQLAIEKPKSIEKSYKDAVSNTSDVPLEELDLYTTPSQLKSNTQEHIFVKEHKTAQKLHENIHTGEELIALTIFHDIYAEDSKGNQLFSVGDKGENEWDKSSSVQAYTRIYFLRKTMDNIPYAKLTKVTGGWNIVDNRVYISNRKVSYGTIGFPAGSNQIRDRYPTGNSYTYYAPSSWDYVNTNALYQLGMASNVTVKLVGNPSNSWGFMHLIIWETNKVHSNKSEQLTFAIKTHRGR